MGADMGIGMWLFWIVGIVAVLLVAKLILVGSSSNTISSTGSSGSDKSETAIDILQKRYAAGEIDADEFERMKKQLVGE